jgi:hypothetical protein
LDAGFTTCRDVGSGEFIDVALKKPSTPASNGPRLFVAGHGSPSLADTAIFPGSRRICISTASMVWLTVLMKSARKCVGT